MQNFIKNDDFPFAFNPFACDSCDGNCCIGESGYIWTAPGEIKEIADFLKMDIELFKKEYLIKVKYRFSLKEIKVDSSYECIFFDKAKNGCTIYPVRPKQCKTFPFWDYFKNRINEVEKECPGIIQL